MALYLDVSKSDKISIDDGKVMISAERITEPIDRKKVRVWIQAERSIPIKLLKKDEQ